MDTLLRMALVLVAAYAAIVVLMYVMQTSMLFPTGLVPGGPAHLPPGARRLHVSTRGGETLAGLHLPGRDEAAPVVLGFGGNAWNADDLALFLQERWPGAEIVTFHYRGYRPSTGRPSAAALMADSVTIHDAVAPAHSGRRVAAVGLSLGAGVAAYLASERPLAGLVLVTPFDSLEAVARDHYFWVPVRLLFRHDIDAARFMAAHERPTAVIGAGRDEVIPPRRTAALLPSIRRLVFHRIIAEASHNDLYGHPGFARAFREALEAVRAAADAPPAGATPTPAGRSARPAPRGMAPGT